MLPAGFQWITDENERIQSDDLMRVRDDEHGEYGEWVTVEHLAGTRLGDFAALHSRNIEFCRPVKPAPEQRWEPLPIEDDTVLQPGRDEVRLQSHDGGRWCAWMPLSSGPLLATAFLAQRPSNFTYEFRRLKAAPEQQPTPTPDRGNKYHRTIRQTLPGDTHGLSLTVDVYDVLQAFGVDCPALQHAVKKLLCAGLRGAKSAEQDISEAANSCRRAIELLEANL